MALTNIEAAQAILHRKTFNVLPTYKGISINKFNHQELIKICCIYASRLSNNQTLLSDVLEKNYGN